MHYFKKKKKMANHIKGKKAEFVAQRLSDNRKERGVALEGEMTKQEKQDNVIVIIQVPLKQKPKQVFSYDDDLSAEGFSDNLFCAAPMAASSSNSWGGELKKRSAKPDVEAAIVKVEWFCYCSFVNSTIAF
ncbi:hypothetical protein RFI_30945 [Reticulomyxa filosa]|uniref:Uncharacterized protein n=1 Tax=Reticulomyxa filosa TaxID=46433 RepID=X6LYN3_RETFI|nr:hypothetical protein RFI_30945 [Reticulomyxa filosa]|eukprot:ETO06446.1 hypothetical protein RFI_30945 [Reticulomyxa filosa]